MAEKAKKTKPNPTLADPPANPTNPRLITLADPPATVAAADFPRGGMSHAETAAACTAMSAAEAATAAPVEGEAKKPSPAEKRAARHQESLAETVIGARAVEAMAQIEPNGMMQFKPKDFAEQYELAGYISKTGIVADGLSGSAAAVFTVMARGEMLGIHWSVAVTEAYVVKGKIGWPAAVMDGLIDRSPAFEYFEVFASSDTEATVEAKKKRWTESRKYTFTIQDAQKAGYLDPASHYSKVWRTRPRLMLIAAARREAARMWDPGRFAGLYTRQELEESFKRDRYDTADALTATSSLADFGASTGTVAPDPAGIVAPGAAEPPPPADGRVRLGPDLAARVRTALASEPHPVDESLLAVELGMPLDEMSAAPGSKPADLLTQVLKSVKFLKTKAAG